MAFPFGHDLQIVCFHVRSISILVYSRVPIKSQDLITSSAPTFRTGAGRRRGLETKESLDFPPRRAFSGKAQSGVAITGGSVLELWVLTQT